MPFLRDEGPPIPTASIQKYRESLPLDYGWQTVNETGREVLVVRVPKPKPDYLHDLGEVAFYVGLDTIRNTKDVLLVGHEKCARLEPQLLRDHIRAQGREDAGVVDGLRRSLDRQYGHTFVQSPSNFEHRAFAVRIPKDTVAQFSPDDVNAIRQVVTNLRPRVMECQYAYVVANGDYERVGKRVLLELIGLQETPAAVSAPAPVIPTVTPPAPTPTAAPAPAPPTPVVAAAPEPQPALPVEPVAAPEVAVHEEYDIVVSKPRVPPAAPAAPALPAGPHGALAGATTVEPEYEVVSKPKPAAAPSPAPAMAAPVGPHSALAGATTVEAEYEVVSKPRPVAATPPAPATPTPAGPHGALAGATTVEAEYEVVSKPKAAPSPAPSASSPAPESFDAEKKVLHGDKEFEVFTSKAKPKPVPTVTPPGMGGFQAAINAAGYGAASHAPAKTKEYEIIGKQSVVSDTSIASKIRLPSATPGAAPAPTSPGLPRIGATPAPSMQASPPAAPMPAAAPTLPHLSFAHTAPTPVAPAPPVVPVPPPSPTAPAAAPAATPPAMGIPHIRFPSATPSAAPAPSAPPAAPPTIAPPVVPTPAAAPAPPVAAPALPRIHFAPAPSAPVEMPAVAPTFAPAPEPAVAPTPAFVPAPAPVPDVVAAIPPKVAPMPLPAADTDASLPRPLSMLLHADSGAPIVPKLTPAAPELALAQRFRDAGYEVVEGLRAQGTVFAFAAHRANGRRVLVKRAGEFGPDDAAALAQLVAALGADVTLVIADSVKPGTRLATWGTRVEVVTPTDAVSMAL